MTSSQTDSVINEILSERDRQIEEEGWTPEHDDEHDDGSLAKAAACYANPILPDPEALPIGWPLSWDWEWWKPKDRRRDLVRAAALIVAEIERLDRQEPPHER